MEDELGFKDWPEDIALDNFEFFMFDFNLFWRSDQGHNFMIIIKRLFIRHEGGLVGWLCTSGAATQSVVRSGLSLDLLTSSCRKNAEPVAPVAPNNANLIFWFYIFLFKISFL